MQKNKQITEKEKNRREKLSKYAKIRQRDSKGRFVKYLPPKKEKINKKQTISKQRVIPSRVKHRELEKIDHFTHVYRFTCLYAIGAKEKIMHLFAYTTKFIEPNLAHADREHKHYYPRHKRIKVTYSHSFKTYKRY